MKGNREIEYAKKQNQCAMQRDFNALSLSLSRVRSVKFGNSVQCEVWQQTVE